MAHSGGSQQGWAYRVNLQDLACSGMHAVGQGEDLAAGHLSSDNGIEAAQSGWVGTSATALRTRWETWLAVSKALLGRVGDHAQGLHDAAISYATTEAKSAEALRTVGLAAHDRTGPAVD